MGAHAPGHQNRSAAIRELLGGGVPAGRSPDKFAVAIVSHASYAHSGAFQEVAEALHCALRSLGHDSVLTTQLDLDERRAILLGSNLMPFFGLEPPRNAILYNLEQVAANSAWMTPAYVEVLRRHRVWDCSRANIER